MILAGIIGGGGAIAVLTVFGRSPRKEIKIFSIILSSYILYSVLFIFDTSLLINNVRYFTLFDDAMISMRYAKNLASGYGLVWNPNTPPVEGYTNFLWVVYMAFWHLLPISSAKISLPIQLTGMFFLVGSLFLVRRIAGNISGKNPYVVLTAVVLTAAYQSINYWGLKGMETSVYGFIVLVMVLRVLKCMDENSFDPYFFLISGTGLLLRPDVAVPFGATTLFLLLMLPQYRRKNIVAALTVVTVTAGGMTLFRYIYYHDFLPNTYYLKMTGMPLSFRILRGLKVADDFMRGITYLLFFAPFFYCVFQVKNKKLLFLLYLFTVQFIYSIYVGGDSWEWWGHQANRYVCVVIPLFFIIVSFQMYDILSALQKRTKTSPVLLRSIHIILIIVLINQFHAGLYANKLENLFCFPAFQKELDKKNVRLAIALKSITTPEAVFACGWAGAPPYFLDRCCIDLLGKNDSYLSRQKTRAKSWREFDPGHHKYDWAYVVKKRKPDIVLDYAKSWLREDEYKRFKADYTVFTLVDKKTGAIAKDFGSVYCRKRSKHIDWSHGIISEIP